MIAAIPTAAKITTEVSTVNSEATRPSLALKIGRIVLKVVLVAIGLATGCVLGLLIALFSGLIDIGC